MQIFDRGLSKHKRNYGTWVKYVSTKSKNPREVFIYWDKVYEGEFVDELKGQILTNKDFLEDLNSYFLTSYRRLKKLTDLFFKRGKSFYAKQSNQTLVSLFQEFNPVNLDALSAYYVPFYLVLALSHLVKDEIEAELHEADEDVVEDIFDTVAKVGIETLVREERLNFLNRLDQIQKLLAKGSRFESSGVEKIIQKQWFDFGACVYTHAEASIYSLLDYKKKFRSSLKLDVRLEASKIKEVIKEENAQISNVFKTYSFSEKLKSYIKWLRIMMTYRNKDAEYYDAYFDHCMPFFEEVAERLKIKIDDLWLFSKGEVVDCLLARQKVQEVVSERKKNGFVIKQVENKVFVLNGVSKADWYERKVNEGVKIIRGNVASVGQAKGFVRVIFNPSREAAKFKEGEILVTSMTTPDFVPLMKKAEAIVTDEGGILCHAAIVSREFNIPCIVGTRISTRVLKNGDFVEVDAQSGLVRIIDRNYHLKTLH